MGTPPGPWLDWPRRPVEMLPEDAFRCSYDVQPISTDSAEAVNLAVNDGR